jgi:hypothetical protein
MLFLWTLLQFGLSYLNFKHFNETGSKVSLGFAVLMGFFALSNTFQLL